MSKNSWGAIGYLVVFAPLLLLMYGQASHQPYLSAAVIFGLGPLMRIALGNIPAQLPSWGETVATWLDRLPLFFAAFFPVATVWFLVDLHSVPPSGPMTWLGLGLSLWTCNFFAVVVAHELIHHNDFRRRVGRLLAAAAGYPLLAHEHLPHHSTSGNVDLAEWPRLDESVWRFSLRRSARIVRSAIEYEAVVRARGVGAKRTGGLAEAVVSTVAVALIFFAASDWSGLLLYLCVCAGVHFGVQAVTYIQHWGLGVDSVDDAAEGRYAWEDRCRFQGWLMLHLALHHAHHQNSATPFYRLAPHPLSPRLPAGYVLMLFASFVPPLWRWLMLPALEQWKRDPNQHVEPTRWRIICLPEHYALSGSA